MNLPHRMAELLSLYLDGALRPEQESELLAMLDDPAQRDTFLTLCQLDRELAGLVATPIDDETMIALVRHDLESMPAESLRVPEVRPRSHRRLWQFAAGLAAAIALVASVVGIRAWTAAEHHVAILEEVEGEVRLHSDGKDQVVQQGQPLFAGNHILTGPDKCGAVIVYADGTRVELGSDTSVGQFADSRGTKRLILDQGLAVIDSRKQASSAPLRVATPQAEVVVRGTRCTMESELHGTQVEVSEGKVQLTRKMDGQSIEVEQGQYAVTAPHEGPFGPEPMTAQPIPVGSVLDASRGIRFSRKGGTSALAYTRDGKRLASCMHSDGTVRVWEMTGTAPQGPTEYRGQNEAGWTVAFSPDSRMLASGGNARTLFLWDVSSQKLLASLPQREHLRAALWSPDGSMLATAGFDGVIRIRDPRSGEERVAIPENEGRGWTGVFGLAFSADSRLLGAALSDRTVRVHELPDGKVHSTLTGHTDIVRSIAFSPNNSRMASASKKEIIIWDVGSGREHFRFDGGNPVAFSPDGTMLAAGGPMPTLRDPATGKVLARIERHHGGVYAYAFSPDNKYLAIGSWYGITLLDLTAFAAANK